MNQRTLATRKVGPPRSVFEQRINQLCLERGLTQTALSEEADFSHETLRNWLNKAAAGELKRTDALHKFATHYKRTVEWLLGEAVLVELPSSAIPDTKAMAEEAVEMLVDIDGLGRAEAAERMLGIFLDKPSVVGFYKAARLKDAPRTKPEDLDPKPPKKPR